MDSHGVHLYREVQDMTPKKNILTSIFQSASYHVSNPAGRSESNGQVSGAE